MPRVPMLNGPSLEPRGAPSSAPNLLSGSSALGTAVQQVCGAIATAVATCLLGLGQTGYAAGGGANAAQGFVDGSRYGYMFGLVLVAIVLVFSFMLKGGKEEPKLVPVQVDDGAVESLAV